jgi:nitrite reductase/ring-hydroxylating ferredoxin subunit
MADFVRVAGKSEIPAGQGRMFDIGGRQVAVFNVAGKFHAIDNVCEHQGGPLAEGELDGCVVTCPWHGWTYDVSSGISPDVPTQGAALRGEGRRRLDSRRRRLSRTA